MYYVLKEKDLFFLFPFFLLRKSFFSKLLPPACFLLGTMAIVPTTGVKRSFFWPRYWYLGATWTLWCSGWTMDGLFVSSVLIISFVFGDSRFTGSASSSASIWSRRDERWFLLSSMVFVVETTLSNSVASFREANAFNCFPRLNMVSWHSANFAEAAVISQSWKFQFQLFIQYCIWYTIWKTETKRNKMALKKFAYSISS